MNNSLMKYSLVKAVIIGIVLWLNCNLVFAETLKPWNLLSPIQQEALSPLASQWDSLPSKLQNHLLLSCKQYPTLTLEKKKLFLSRLQAWSKLTPEQREHARQKYLAIKKLSAEKQAELRRAAIEKANKNAAASNVQAASSITQTIDATQPVITEHL
jgi:hypothetical protein